jgi:hypothetical protein
MPLVVPLQAVPSQNVSVTLNNQECQLSVYTENGQLYMNVSVANALIIGGVIAENLNLIVRSLYLGFLGDFVFLDNSGNGADPVFAGLGSVFSLIYLFPADLQNLPAGVG